MLTKAGFTPGCAKNTYGTGCFLLYNVGDEPVISEHGLLATIAYDFGGHRKPVYALEGSIAVAGSGVKFLMNNMGFITHSEKISELAATVEDNGGCVFVTAFSGLFAPYWIDDAKVRPDVQAAQTLELIASKLTLHRARFLESRSTRNAVSCDNTLPLQKNTNTMSSQVTLLVPHSK